MEYALPIVFVSIMGLALFFYVVLDGYDLGIGMLFPFATDDEKDTMIASIGPFWDANETWIVLGVGVLLIAFPGAHGQILSALYFPVTIMLMGLILRGVAFDFRVKAGDNKKSMWNKLFFIGSLVASMAQGWMLGSYVTGMGSGWLNITFSTLIAFALPALYIVLGAAWLLIKTEGDLQKKAICWARHAVPPMGVGLLLISIATPLVSDVIAARWFVLPNAIGLLPIPLISLLAFFMVYWILNRPDILGMLKSWVVFAGVVLIIFMAAIGLAYSIFPDIIIGKLTIWEAASATDSLLFVFWGVMFTLPAIFIYTFVVYRIFSGKASKLSYQSD